MRDSQCIVELQLLKDCLFAFNEIPNKHLSNGIKTYDIASRLDNVFRVTDSAVYFILGVDDVKAIRKGLTSEQALIVLDHIKFREDVYSWIKKNLLNSYIEKLFPLLE